MSANGTSGARPAAWTGVLAAGYGLVSLAGHALLLVLLGTLPRLVRFSDLEVRRAALAQGEADGGGVAFVPVYDALDVALPFVFASLGLAVLLAITIVLLGAATTFGKRRLRRLLPWALVVEAARAIGWAVLASAYVAPGLLRATEAFDTATVSLTARGAGLEDKGVTDFAELAFSAPAIWLPVVAHSVVLGALAMLAWRKLRAPTAPDPSPAALTPQSGVSR